MTAASHSSSEAELSSWDSARRQELSESAANGKVGSRLVSETDDLRVWHIHLEPGARIGFHRHVLDYFWTAVTGGTARSHFGDGSVHDVAYRAGDTRHFSFDAGASMVHDLMNTGPHPLIFVTVEFKRGKNSPLPLAPEDAF